MSVGRRSRSRRRRRRREVYPKQHSEWEEDLWTINGRLSI